MPLRKIILMIISRLLWVSLLLILPACSRAEVTFTPTHAPSLTPPSPTPTTRSPTSTNTVAPALTPTPLPTPTALPEVCSPLEGIPTDSLPAMVVNPYHPPPPGSDDPHQAVDLAILAPGTRVALAGSPVQAALGGKVVMVVHDRFPYGSAVLIETVQTGLPPDMRLPAPAPTPAQHSALTCPAVAAPPALEPTSRSLYLLYAHLQSDPEVQPGQEVSCGQVLGKVGASGNALNPHLHFEMRAGPSGAQFASMAHYDASASPEEMSNYCLWRTSGLFEVMNPLSLFTIQPP